MNQESERKILLVEDNPDDELLTLRIFAKNSIRNEVIVVRDGQEALDWLFRSGQYVHLAPDPAPAVVLLDLKLPKVDGLEVLHRIREDPRTKMIPVVILTSSKEEQDVIESYKFGANSYVRKPIHFGEFSEAVGRLGTYWLLVNEGPPKNEVPRERKAA